MAQAHGICPFRAPSFSCGVPVNAASFLRTGKAASAASGPEPECALPSPERPETPPSKAPGRAPLRRQTRFLRAFAETLSGRSRSVLRNAGSPAKPRRTGTAFRREPRRTAFRGVSRGKPFALRGHRFPRCGLFAVLLRRSRKRRLPVRRAGVVFGPGVPCRRPGAWKER